MEVQAPQAHKVSNFQTEQEVTEKGHGTYTDQRRETQTGKHRGEGLTKQN